MDKGLIGNRFCRNPNDALRPWCYINEFCDMNLCDVCGIGKCLSIQKAGGQRVCRQQNKRLLGLRGNPKGVDFFVMQEQSRRAVSSTTLRLLC